MVEIADLFEVSRLPRGWMIIPIIFYAPLGLLLFISRLFIGIQALIAASILPENSAMRSFVLRVMCTVLGIVVKSCNEEEKRNVKLLVTNHVSCLDHLAIHLLNNSISPRAWDFPSTITWALGYRDLGVKQGRTIFIDNVKKHISTSSIPLLGHPEGATTNGKIGLLQFNSWLFGLDHPVQPIAIKVERPFFCNIAPGVLGSRWWSDLFWFLFVPWTVFYITYLPVMNKNDASVDEFSKNVAKVIGDYLNLELTEFTCSDKMDFMKQRLKPQTSSTQLSSNRHLQAQIEKVKEILPHVPEHIISSDLKKTGNLDATIFRILDGAIPEAQRYVQISAMASASRSQPNAVDKNYSLDTSAKQFPSRATERMASFADRKKKLYENARRRYIEKHNLKVPGYNC